MDTCGSLVFYCLPAASAHMLPLDVDLLLQLLATAVLFLVVLVLNLVMTFKATPDSGARGGRGWVMDGFAVVTAIALSVLSSWIMAKEFRPESFDEYWTGLLYWLPLALSLTTFALAAVRHLEVGWSRKRRWFGRILAWGVPAALWIMTWGVLFLLGGASAHF